MCDIEKWLFNNLSKITSGVGIVSPVRSFFLIQIFVDMNVFLSLSSKQNGGQGAPVGVIVTRMGATYSGIDASVFLLILCLNVNNIT